jgi:tRNA A-37 threonylcarbamoyl transferase component Bud32/DNA-directed RNA polymerase specialized sigma24 family protein
VNRTPKLEKEKNTSESLLNRYLASSSQAPFLIHERYQTRLLQLARAQLMGVLKSKVAPEDVTQETFLAFFDLADRGEVRWQKNGDLWRLLAGIAANKTKQQFDFYNAAKRDIKSESCHAQHNMEIVSDQASSQNLTELLEHLLNSEKPLVRSVLELRLAGYNTSEIGERIGRSSRTVRRIIESLQAKLLADNELESGYLSDYGIRSKPESSVDSNLNNNLLDYNDFQLLRMIGQGSFAKVYLAKQISTGNLFAMKAIRKKWFSNLAARTGFAKEARLLNQLSDPNIIKFFGVGALPNKASFLLLELVEGKPILEAAKHAAPEMVSNWLQTIESTIEKVHESGITHGDLRSPNILVDNTGQVRIIDFGLGGFVDTSLGDGSTPTIADDQKAIRDLKMPLSNKLAPL